MKKDILEDSLPAAKTITTLNCLNFDKIHGLNNSAEKENPKSPSKKSKRIRKRGLKYDKITEYQKRLVVKDIYMSKVTFKEAARLANVKISTAKTIVARFKASKMTVEEFLSQRCEREISDFQRRDKIVNETLHFSTQLSSQFLKKQLDKCLWYQFLENQEKIRLMMQAMQFYKGEQ